jgi:transposase-like protein
MPLHALSSGPDDSGPDARWERPKPERNYLLRPAYREVSQARIYALSEPAAIRMLADLRWALDGKQVCPECGTIDTHYWSKRLLRWECRSKVCRKQFSVFSGTKLHGTKMPAKQVLSFLLDFVEAKDGISARELSGRHDRDHQTMHVMSMKVREAIRHTMSVEPPLKGYVQADAAYFIKYVRPRNLGNGAAFKAKAEQKNVGRLRIAAPPSLPELRQQTRLELEQLRHGCTPQ